MSYSDSGTWMDSDMTLYRDNIQRFIKDVITPNKSRWYAQGYVDRDVWNKAGELGYLLADVPEEFGGSGGTYAHMAVFWEELVKAGDPGFDTQVHAVAAHYILNNGTKEQKEYYLPKLASGEMVAAIAVTEAGAGSDIQAVSTKAVRNANHYLLNGSKSFISNGLSADLIILVAKTNPDAGSRGLSLFLVETKELQGFKTGKNLETIGRKSHDICELYFDNVCLPLSSLLGSTEGRGLAQLMKELPYERTIVGINAVAAIEHAVEITLAHTQQRKVFGKPLFELQNTRFKLAEAKTQAVIARVFINWCIQQVLDGLMTTELASMAKWYLSDMQCRVIDECLQLFGGYGYMMEYPIAQMYADARAQKIYGGANEVMKEIIAYSL